MSVNRRIFLASGAALSMPAADRVRAGIIGAGGRGRYLTAQFKEVGAEVAAVCDIYQPNLEAGLKAASTGAQSHTSYRKLLEDKSLDVVIVATPDHWHAQMTIDAVEAGKDVYVEKPLAHTVEEGFRIIEAVRRTRRIVQVGTQRRSSELFQEAKGIIDSGAVGEVRLVNSWWLNHQRSLSSNTFKGDLDWKQWLGSAPDRPMDPMRFFNWYYFWDYSGGLMVGQAAHIIDCINWFMGSKAPLAVTTSAGQNNLAGGEVPDTTCLTVEYPENYLAVFTLGYKAMRYNGFNDQMQQYHGMKARFDMGRESYALYPENTAVEMKPSAEKKLPGSFDSATRAHIRNLLECVKSRREPNAPVEAGQAANIVLCMAMESLRKGRRLRFNAASRRVEG